MIWHSLVISSTVSASSSVMPLLNFMENPSKKISLNLSPLSALSLSNRDGPDQNSPQIGQFSGNTALESVYSTSNQILIKFHSDFTTSGFFCSVIMVRIP